jgi:hypothetical protein
LKNSLYASFDPRLGPKHTVFGFYWSFWSLIRSHFQLSSDFFNKLMDPYSISYAEWPAKRCSDGRIEGESTKKRLTERDKRRQSLGR